MEFLVMVEEGSDRSPVLARVDSMPALRASEPSARDVVTVYGVPTPESLAMALAAAVESHRTAGDDSAAFRHLGIWPERGAVGDTAWRDALTGELKMSDLEIPLEVLTELAHQLLAECGSLIRRLVAGLAMPGWPDGARRALNITLNPVMEPARAARSRLESLLDVFREAQGLAYETEGD
ncbi:MAG TPA: hypothetical protein VFW98_14890 [Gemmatimonadaceae bacterium]|nr:hypothetical protein [Gemmatimonadaceae bacterium]